MCIASEVAVECRGITLQLTRYQIVGREDGSENNSALQLLDMAMS